MAVPRSPRKPGGYSDELIDEALAVFQPRTSRTLTREDGRQIVHNLSGYFQTLLEWKRAARTTRAKASSTQRPEAPVDRLLPTGEDHHD